MNKELQDKLLGALIGLVRATEGTNPSKKTSRIIIEGLTKCYAPNISDDEAKVLLQTIKQEKEELVPDCSKCQSPCGRTDDYDMNKMWDAEEDIRSAKLSILEKIHRTATHLYSLKEDSIGDEMEKALYEALYMVGYAESSDILIPLIKRLDDIR